MVLSLPSFYLFAHHSGIHIMLQCHFRQLNHTILRIWSLDPMIDGQSCLKLMLVVLCLILLIWCLLAEMYCYKLIMACDDHSWYVVGYKKLLFLQPTGSVHSMIINTHTHSIWMSLNYRKPMGCEHRGKACMNVYQQGQRGNVLQMYTMGLCLYKVVYCSLPIQGKRSLLWYNLRLLG